MARNRIIKPEFWADAKVGRLSFGARLLYIAMWNFSDDYGTISASPRRLLGEAFENDESVTLENVIGWLKEIESQGMIRKYTAKDKDWYEIPKFNDHQKGFNKSARRNPECNNKKDACNNEKDACNTHATCMLNGNENDNENDNEKDNENGNDDETPTATRMQRNVSQKGALDAELDLFEKAIAITKENLTLTSERRAVIKDIRGNVNAGADKFLRAVKNMMKSNWPTKSVTYFTDKKFDAINRIDLFANSPPKGNGFDRSPPLAPLKSIEPTVKNRIKYDSTT